MKTLQDQLTYINHYPETQKYISLFPKNDDERSKERREQAMAKVLHSANFKRQIRDRDLDEELTGGESIGKSK